MLQNPRMRIGSWVSAKKIIIIRCISIGNEYHALHWYSLSFILANSLVTAVPSSVYMNIGANDQAAKFNGEINSVKFDLWLDFYIVMGKKEKKSHFIEFMHRFVCGILN